MSLREPVCGNTIADFGPSLAIVTVCLRSVRLDLACASLLFASLSFCCASRAADPPVMPPDAFGQLTAELCADCHSGPDAEARLDLGVLAGYPMSKHLDDWRRVQRALAEGAMPPEDSDQPTVKRREEVINAINDSLRNMIRRAAHDPGPAVVRRLTNAEYEYCMEDLTGVSLDLRDLLISDSVGGSGFTNSATGQFMQDATLQRYVEAANLIADHALIGAGPIFFYEDAGRTGQELSAINRLQRLYRQHGFRSGAGEGARPYGMERFATSFQVAWQYRYRRQLGLAGVTLGQLASQHALETKFAEHVWEVLNRNHPQYPLSEIVAAWNEFPHPGEISGDVEARIEQEANDLYELLLRWQAKFAGTASAQEEAALLTDDNIDVPSRTRFQARATRKTLVVEETLELNEDDERLYSDDGRIQFKLSIQSATANNGSMPVVIFSSPEIRFLYQDSDIVQPDPVPLQTVLKSGYVINDKPSSNLDNHAQQRLIRFGENPGGQPIGENDFVVKIGTAIILALELPEGSHRAELLVDAKLDPLLGRDAVVRCTIEDITSGDGRAYSTLMRDRDSTLMDRWETGLEEFAKALPQISHREPAPSDRDPIPDPYDNTYNTADRNYFHTAVKYHRKDDFLVQRLADPDVVQQLDIAWTDLLTSFDYHDVNFRFAARKFGFDVEGRSMAAISQDWIKQLPAELRLYVQQYKNQYDAMQAALRSAEQSHLKDIVELASRAWRRTLSEVETAALERFYRDGREHGRSHSDAIRATIVRVLVSPDFLYRVEQPPNSAEPANLSDHELASRLSFSIWSSLPDAELIALARRGELSKAAVLTGQVQRMLSAPKSRRLATEFFGQWLGFYHFDQFRGVDQQRFPEFDEATRRALYNEAISFFEYLVRADRPYTEILEADYTFLDSVAAQHYGIELGTDDSVADRATDRGLDSRTRKTSVESSGRGGLLGMGAMLTLTSAPLRTSPVKRGDWILRRLLGTPVPPPPPDAGSIPAEEILSDGKTVRDRLEVHRTRTECMNCHVRIDPLGFALEHFDSLGRWRESYGDGKPVDASGTLADGQTIHGVAGLKAYLHEMDPLFRRSLATNLVAYFLGRSETVADAALIESIVSKLESDPRISVAVMMIVQSPQFRQIRGSEYRE